MDCHNVKRALQKKFHLIDPVYERSCDFQELCAFDFLSMIEEKIAKNEGDYRLFVSFSIRNGTKKSGKLFLFYKPDISKKQTVYRK